MSLNAIFRELEDKIDDLQRDTKFCINSYDYHHKNNEFDILSKCQEILNECAPDGREFLKNLENVRQTIEAARKKCQEADEILKEAGIDSATTKTEEDSGNTGNCSSTGQSISFREEDQNVCDEADNNKENMK